MIFLSNVLEELVEAAKSRKIIDETFIMYCISNLVWADPRAYYEHVAKKYLLKILEMAGKKYQNHYFDNLFKEAYSKNCIIFQNESEILDLMEKFKRHVDEQGRLEGEVKNKIYPSLLINSLIVFYLKDLNKKNNFFLSSSNKIPNGISTEISEKIYTVLRKGGFKSYFETLRRFTSRFLATALGMRIARGGKREVPIKPKKTRRPRTPDPLRHMFRRKPRK